MTASGWRGRLGRLLRRFLVAMGAAVLLWAGLGNPARPRPAHRASWITVEGLRLRALRAGHGDTTLVFLHGYGESLMAWRLLLDRFTARYAVLAVDLPGHGLSDRPDGPYDYPALVARLARMLDQETRGPVILVGHSMGGQLATGVALARPERVRALVLIAPAGDGINPILTDTGGVASPATAWVASALSFVLPVHDSAWLREADGEGPAGGDSAAARTARAVLAQFDFSAIGEGFRGVRQPVLLVWGRQDPTIPYEIGERVAALLPCRRFVSLAALHRPHQTLPDTVAAEMTRFLARPGCD
ncbi:MAG: alpha/beta fold hydrolase [Gemmatimonadales bacterium]